MTVAIDTRLTHFRFMLLARMLEDRLRSLYRRGEIPGGVYLGKGQESFSAAFGMQLRTGDIFAPAIRDMAGRLAFGESIDEGLLVYLGRRSGSMRGRDGNIHRGSVETGLLPMISHLGAMSSTVSGMLLARRLRGDLEPGDNAVGLISLGDGAMATGAAHEGLNMMAVERLPVVVMVANNQLAYSTTNAESFACEDLLSRATAYGMAGHRCDGEDPADCLRVAQQAVAAARRGEGPQMVVARLLRMSGHGEHDDATYTPKELLAAARDCLDVGREQLSADGHTSDLEAMEREHKATIDAAVERCLAAPEPDPDREDWYAYSERWLDQGLKP